MSERKLKIIDINILGAHSIPVAAAGVYGSALPGEYTADSCPQRCGFDFAPMCTIRRSDGDMQVYLNQCYWAMDNCGRSGPER